MAASGLWRMALRLLRPVARSARVDMESLSNEDLDRMLEDDRG